MINREMVQIRVLSAGHGQGRVMLSALVEATVRHLVMRGGREFFVSMREKGKEFLPDAEHTKAELIASNLAMQFALGKALADPDTIPPHMELAVSTDRIYCGRVRFAFQLPEEGTAEEISPDANLLIVPAAAPDAVIPTAQKFLNDAENTPVCIALFCDHKPSPADDANAMLRSLSPALIELFGEREWCCECYNPCGFQPDGSICSADHASPVGAAELFWDAVGFAAKRREAYFRQELHDAAAVIKRRNSVYQANAPRRLLELRHNRGVYAAAVKGLYEAQTLLAAATGMPLPGDGKE